MACFADVNVSQGSVETYARCGGIFDISLTANLPRNLPVKKFIKSVKNWQNYGHESAAPFFADPAMTTTPSAKTQDTHRRISTAYEKSQLLHDLLLICKRCRYNFFNNVPVGVGDFIMSLRLGLSEADFRDLFSERFLGKFAVSGHLKSHHILHMLLHLLVRH